MIIGMLLVLDYVVAPLVLDLCCPHDLLYVTEFTNYSRLCDIGCALHL